MNDRDMLVGFAMFVSDPGGDAVFINIAGEVDLPQLVEIGHKFGLPPLSDLAGLDLESPCGVDPSEDPDGTDGESKNDEMFG
jgi:hypothetical protein